MAYPVITDAQFESCVVLEGNQTLDMELSYRVVSAAFAHYLNCENQGRLDAFLSTAQEAAA